MPGAAIAASAGLRRVHAPRAQSSPGASAAPGRLRSAGTGACRACRPRSPGAPPSRSGQRSRACRGCGVRDRRRVRGPPAPGRIRLAAYAIVSPSGIALAVRLRRSASAAAGPPGSRARPAPAPSGELIAGSPSTFSSASRLIAPLRTCSTSAASAGWRRGSSAATSVCSARPARSRYSDRLAADQHHLRAGRPAPAAGSSRRRRASATAAPPRRAAPDRRPQARSAAPRERGCARSRSTAPGSANCAPPSPSTK